MRQISFFIKTLSDLPACIDAFWDECPEGSHHILVSVYSGWTSGAKLHKLLSDIKKELPGAIIAGCTTGGEIFAGTVSDNTTILSFMIFDNARLNIRVYDLSVKSGNEAADDLIASIGRIGTPVGIELLMTPPNPSVYQFLRRLSALPPSVQVFGGIAGETEDAGQYVFTANRIFDNAIIAICFLGDSLRMRVHSCLGWTPLGRSMRITQMRGDNTIVTLDHHPAIDFYERYLKITPETFKEERLVFPLLFERNGKTIARMPKDSHDDGSLTLFGDCKKDEHVRLAYGDPSSILSSVRDMQLEVATFSPEAIVIFNCLSRRLFLRSDSHFDVRSFPLIAPTAGAYVHGEIARQGSEAVLLNMSMLAVCMREGPGVEPKKIEIPLEEHLDRTMRVVQRLAHFIQVTTAELEDANHQLARLAKIDRLTGIFNRGEIESILQKEINGKRNKEEPISAIMIDLDDFKKINDTYGHAIGDQVLQWVGRVLLRNTRRRDAAGRWGGEEFLILLPGAHLKAAADIAERIRAQIASEPILPDGKSISASLGVAEFPRSSSFKAFYRALDDALYQAKAQGKNRVVSAENEQHEN